MIEGTKELEVRSIPMGELTIEQGSLAISLSRAEIDQQVSTAHAWPRSVTRAIDNIMSLATLDEESAKECIYALPRAGKAIKGPSVRLAEIIASQWGNCRIGARVVHVDRIEKFVEAEGVFHDLETNTATTSRVKRRLSDREARIFNEDMIIVTGNAACAIAKRNAILSGIPKAVWRRAYDSVESVIMGDVKTLAERRDRSIKAFAKFGVKPEEIFTALGVAGESDITLEHMGMLVGMHSAIKNNESTIEEMFPKTRIKDGGAPRSLAEKLSGLAGAHATPSEIGLAGGEGARPEPPKQYAVDQRPIDPETGEIVDVQLEAMKAADTVMDVTAMPAETAALLLAGKLAARAGQAAFKKWWNRLSAPDVERLEPYMEELHTAIIEKASDRG